MYVPRQGTLLEWKVLDYSAHGGPVRILIFTQATKYLLQCLPYNALPHYKGCGKFQMHFVCEFKNLRGTSWGLNPWSFAWEAICQTITTVHGKQLPRLHDLIIN